MSNELTTTIRIRAKDEATPVLRNTISGLHQLKSAGDSIMQSFRSGAGGLAASLFGAGFGASIKAAIDSLDKMDEAAERIGTTTESLSALAYAGKQSGLEFEDLNKALVKFSGDLAHAASGNRDAIALMDRLGVSAGNFSNLGGALGQVADRFANTADGVGKTALATDAFGDKLGARLVPLLNQGSEGLRAMAKEADALGAIYDSKLAKQAAEFNDNLDRLTAVSGAAGRAIATELLPTLNRFSNELLIGLKNSDGFLDALQKYGLTNPFKDQAQHLRELNEEASRLEDKISIGRGNADDETRLRSLQQQINYYRELEALRNRVDSPGRRIAGDAAFGGMLKPGNKISTARETTRAFQDYGATLTERIAQAIDKTDIVKARELESTLRKLDELAAAGLDPAIVQAVRDDLTGATKAAAGEMARLNQLLGETESGKLAAVRSDMELLARALADGRISEETYFEAIAARFDESGQRIRETGERIRETKSIAEEFGFTFNSALEDAIVNGKNASQVVQGLGQDIARIAVRRSITEPLGNAVGSLISSFAGDKISGLFNAKGNVFSSPSLHQYANQVRDTPTFFGFNRILGFREGGVFGEAGPEAIMPLSRGKDGRLGVRASGSGCNVFIEVNNNAAGTKAVATSRQDENGDTLISIVVDAVDTQIARNITKGYGRTTEALQSTYGLNRASGGW